MTRVLCVSVILVLLAVLWCDHTAQSQRSLVKGTWSSPCKCQFIPKKKVICKNGLSPKEHKEARHCMCKQQYNDMLINDNLQKYCRKVRISIPLPLA